MFFPLPQTAAQPYSVTGPPACLTVHEVFFYQTFSRFNFKDAFGDCYETESQMALVSGVVLDTSDIDFCNEITVKFTL